MSLSAGTQTGSVSHGTSTGQYDATQPGTVAQGIFVWGVTGWHVAEPPVQAQPGTRPHSMGCSGKQPLTCVAQW